MIKRLLNCFVCQRNENYREFCNFVLISSVIEQTPVCSYVWMFSVLYQPSLDDGITMVTARIFAIVKRIAMLP